MKSRLTLRSVSLDVKYDGMLFRSVLRSPVCCINEIWTHDTRASYRQRDVQDVLLAIMIMAAVITRVLLLRLRNYQLVRSTGTLFESITIMTARHKRSV